MYKYLRNIKKHKHIKNFKEQHFFAAVFDNTTTNNNFCFRGA